MESILTSIKKMLGITEEYEHFDSDLIIHINSVFMILRNSALVHHRDSPFRIKALRGKNSFPMRQITASKVLHAYEGKLIFDPPLSSAV